MTEQLRIFRKLHPLYNKDLRPINQEERQVEAITQWSFDDIAPNSKALQEERSDWWNLTVVQPSKISKISGNLFPDLLAQPLKERYTGNQSFPPESSVQVDGKTFHLGKKKTMMYPFIFKALRKVHCVFICIIS